MAEGSPSCRSPPNGKGSTGTASRETVPVLELLDAIRYADSPDTANGPPLVLRLDDARISDLSGFLRESGRELSDRRRALHPVHCEKGNPLDQ